MSLRMPDIILWCVPKLYRFHHNKECAFRKFIEICVHERLMSITWRILRIYVRECVKYMHVNHDAIADVSYSLPHRCSGIFKIFPKESGFIGMKWQMFINLKTKKWSAHLLKLNNNSWICVWTLRHRFSVCWSLFWSLCFSLEHGWRSSMFYYVTCILIQDGQNVF